VVTGGRVVGGCVVGGEVGAAVAGGEVAGGIVAGGMVAGGMVAAGAVGAVGAVAGLAVAGGDVPAELDWAWPVDAGATVGAAVAGAAGTAGAGGRPTLVAGAWLVAVVPLEPAGPFSCWLLELPAAPQAPAMMARRPAAAMTAVRFVLFSIDRDPHPPMSPGYARDAQRVRTC
jgi:hypothetical protein